RPQRILADVALADLKVDGVDRRRVHLHEQVVVAGLRVGEVEGDDRVEAAVFLNAHGTHAGSPGIGTVYAVIVSPLTPVRVARGRKKRVSLRSDGALPRGDGVSPRVEMRLPRSEGASLRSGGVSP